MRSRHVTSAPIVAASFLLGCGTASGSRMHDGDAITYVLRCDSGLSRRRAADEPERDRLGFTGEISYADGDAGGEGDYRLLVAQALGRYRFVDEVGGGAEFLFGASYVDYSAVRPGYYPTGRGGESTVGLALGLDVGVDLHRVVEVYARGTAAFGFESALSTVSWLHSEVGLRFAVEQGLELFAAYGGWLVDQDSYGGSYDAAVFAEGLVIGMGARF